MHGATSHRPPHAHIVYYRSKFPCLLRRVGHNEADLSSLLAEEGNRPGGYLRAGCLSGHFYGLLRFPVSPQSQLFSLKHKSRFDTIFAGKMFRCSRDFHIAQPVLRNIMYAIWKSRLQNGNCWHPSESKQIHGVKRLAQAILDRHGSPLPFGAVTFPTWLWTTWTAGTVRNRLH